MQLQNLELNQQAHEGRWVGILEDFEILVRSALTPGYEMRRIELQKAHPVIDKVPASKWPPETYKEYNAILARAFVEALVLDWRGAHDAEGNELPYDAEKLIEMCLDPKTSYIYQYLMRCADQLHEYVGAPTKEELGN